MRESEYHRQRRRKINASYNELVKKLAALSDDELNAALKHLRKIQNAAYKAHHKQYDIRNLDVILHCYYRVEHRLKKSDRFKQKLLESKKIVKRIAQDIRDENDNSNRESDS